MCAATSVNLDATIAALAACLDQIEFADCVLLTDASLKCEHEGIRVVPIAPLNSSRDYSKFVLTHLVDHFESSHCLIVQWDGFVLDAKTWEDRFLEFDYIGSPWPQFEDDHVVGNGGFSIRSRKLFEACRDPSFLQGHPEDIAICRTNRHFLENNFGMRFADPESAARFAFERGVHRGATFGFHGIFNMIDVLGPERFWEVYSTLDSRSTALVDYRRLMSQLGQGTKKWSRRLRLTADWLEHFLRR